MQKKVVFVLMFIFIMSLLGATALAKSTSGQTSGGELGRATGCGEMSVTNSTSAGQDTVTGKTKSSVSESSNWVYAKIYYAYSQGNGSNSSTGRSNGTNWATTSVKPDKTTGQGYKGVTAHTVNTTNYGGWTGDLSETW